MNARVRDLLAYSASVLAVMLAWPAQAQPVPEFATIVQWTFDEPVWLYPSHVMATTDGIDAPLVLGLGVGSARADREMRCRLSPSRRS